MLPIPSADEFAKSFEQAIIGLGTASISQQTFPQPLWTGEQDVSGKTIYVNMRQGFGNAIQCCRYVPLLAQRGANVILGVDEQLETLMQCLPARVITIKDPFPEFDMHCPLEALPMAFKTGKETIPADVPYLRAPRDAAWPRILEGKPRPLVGLCWSGRSRDDDNRDRSIPLNLLTPLLAGEATFVSLQKDIRPQDAMTLNRQSNLIHYQLGDFGNVAALIDQLDLVISIDTSMTHLAGALAKPVWILLYFFADWRWMLDRKTTPWYPTARLFRQDERRDLRPVIESVRAELRQMK